jgi:hypothetical protein
LLFDAPAELLFHHELVEQHDIRRQFVDERVEAAVVEFDRHFAMPSGQVSLCSPAGRAAEGDVPALLQECLEDLHHVATGCRRARFGPDVTDDQNFGGGG